MRPYILLTVDSLRKDRVTPDLLERSLDVLERDFVYFSGALSYGVATPFAFPGIMAGTHPVDDGRIPDDVPTLAEGFTGETTALPNNAHLHEERGYARGFDAFVESPSAETETDPSVVETLVDAVKRVEHLQNSRLANRIYRRFFQGTLPQPSVSAEDMATVVRERLRESPDGFLWSHWMDPHTPYHPDTAVDPPNETPDLPALAELHDRIVAADASTLSGAEIELAESLYDANIRYFDHHFGELLEWFADQPWYDDALITIVSDHGEYFGEHGQLFHTWDIDPYDEAIRTPLWVKYPDQTDGGETHDHLVGHGDVVATAAEFDGFELEPPSHTAPLRETAERHVVSVSNTAKRLTERDGSYIVRRDGSEDDRERVSSEGEAFLRGVPFPECVNSKGNAQGVEEAERQRRLHDLGYR